MSHTSNENLLFERVNDNFFPVHIPYSDEAALALLDRVFNDPLYDSVVLSNNQIAVYWENLHNPSLVYEVCSFIAAGDIENPIEHLYDLACANPSMIIMIKTRPELFGE